MVVVGVIIVISSNNTKNKTEKINGQNVEILNTHEEVVEPSNTNSAVTRRGCTSEGFCRCSKWLCKEFEGRGDVCKNCGHAYKAHY